MINCYHFSSNLKCCTAFDSYCITFNPNGNTLKFAVGKGKT